MLVWVYLRPQLWFEQLVIMTHMWREHFRFSRNTFDFICALVGPYVTKQNTVLGKRCKRL
jgi:hypothetical protein